MPDPSADSDPAASPATAADGDSAAGDSAAGDLAAGELTTAPSPMPAAASQSHDLQPYTQDWYDRSVAILGPEACRQLGFYVLPPEFVLSVVIPVYNERETLRSLVDRVRSVPIRKEIVLVDDGSTDGTGELFDGLAALSDGTNTIRTYEHEFNRGKGAAVRTGFGKATGHVVAVQDADLEYDPAEFPRLLQPIVENRADIVYGSRFLGDRPHRVLYYWHFLGNQFLTTLSNAFTNLNLTDMETCYKLFRKEVLDQVGPTLQQDRFGIEPEITAKIARRNAAGSRWRIFEMSISYHGRTYDDGKKIGWRDGFKALWCIVKYGLGG